MGTIGRFVLAGYLVIVGAAYLIGGTAIPGWFVGVLAIAAAVALLTGK